jgi:biotin operon repressor
MPEIQISEAAALMGRAGGTVAAEKLRKKLKLSRAALSEHMRQVANARYAKGRASPKRAAARA